MPYATVDQIAGEFKDFTPTSAADAYPSAVTIEDIQEFLLDADSEINSLLSVNYVTPITGPDSLRVMKMAEIWLVKDRILDVIAVKTGQPKTTQDGVTTYRQKALNLLSLYVKGTAFLIDATTITSGSIGQFSCGEGPRNVFDRSVSQW